MSAPERWPWAWTCDACGWVHDCGDTRPTGFASCARCGQAVVLT